MRVCHLSGAWGARPVPGLIAFVRGEQQLVVTSIAFWSCVRFGLAIEKLRCCLDDRRDGFVDGVG